MKINAFRSRKAVLPLVAWSEAEYAAKWAKITDTFEDRVSENVFDVDGEHAEVDLIVHREKLLIRDIDA